MPLIDAADPKIQQAIQQAGDIADLCFMRAEFEAIVEIEAANKEMGSA